MYAMITMNLKIFTLSKRSRARRPIVSDGVYIKCPEKANLERGGGWAVATGWRRGKNEDRPPGPGVSWRGGEWKYSKIRSWWWSHNPVNIRKNIKLSTLSGTQIKTFFFFLVRFTGKLPPAQLALGAKRKLSFLPTCTRFEELTLLCWSSHENCALWRNSPFQLRPGMLSLDIISDLLAMSPRSQRPFPKHVFTLGQHRPMGTFPAGGGDRRCLSPGTRIFKKRKKEKKN